MMKRWEDETETKNREKTETREMRTTRARMEHVLVETKTGKKNMA